MDEKQRRGEHGEGKLRSSVDKTHLNSQEKMDGLKMDETLKGFLEMKIWNIKIKAQVQRRRVGSDGWRAVDQRELKRRRCRWWSRRAMVWTQPCRAEQRVM